MPGDLWGVLSVRVLIPALSSILCWIFSALLLAQWAARRRPYQLIWAIGLLF